MADRILLLRDGVLVDELVGDFFKHSRVDVTTKKQDEGIGERAST